MPFFLRGALVEYGSDVLGPIPNIVVFQFNPEQLSRSFTMPRENREADQPEEKSSEREPHQASASPGESFSLTAHFSAADDLGKGGAAAAIPRLFGIGPQLAALEQMALPKPGALSGAIGAAVDAIGDAISGGGDDGKPEQPTPREQSPRILFIWGPSRILPVEIQSMSITEQKFDPLLNAVQAQVQLGLAVASYPQNSKEDPIGQGALKYTNTVKEAQALLNLVKAAELAIDTIPF